MWASLAASCLAAFLFLYYVYLLTYGTADSDGRQLESHTNHAFLRCDRTHVFDIFETPSVSESARWDSELLFHLFYSICCHVGLYRM